MRPCLVCGTQNHPKNGWQRLYCGPTCIEQAQANGTFLKATSKNPVVLTCRVCERQYLQRGAKPSATCSAACTKAQQRSQRTKLKGTWYLMDPWRKVYQVDCIQEFVRSHSDLFAWCDIRPQLCGTYTTTNAARSLSSLHSGRVAQWDGWRLATKDQFDNQ